jgi:hypothetical protein
MMQARHGIIGVRVRLICITLMVLSLGARAGRAAELTAEVVAVSDEAVLVDVHATTPHGPQSGWLVLTGRPAGSVQRFWRELPKELGGADCDKAMSAFSKVLEQRSIGGVQLDARQCGRNDKPFWAASQVLLDGKAVNGRFITWLTVERAKATRDQTAYGPFPGTRYAGSFTGKFLNLTRDGLSFAALPTVFSPPSPQAGWVVVAPGGALVAAFDADYGGFQVWIRSGTRWRSALLVNALDLQ